MCSGKPEAALPRAQKAATPLPRGCGPTSSWHSGSWTRAGADTGELALEAGVMACAAGEAFDEKPCWPIAMLNFNSQHQTRLAASSKSEQDHDQKPLLFNAITGERTMAHRGQKKADAQPQTLEWRAASDGTDGLQPAMEQGMLGTTSCACNQTAASDGTDGLQPAMEQGMLGTTSGACNQTNFANESVIGSGSDMYCLQNLACSSHHRGSSNHVSAHCLCD